MLRTQRATAKRLQPFALWSTLALFAAPLGLAGCGGGAVATSASPPYVPPAGAFTGAAFSGRVLAGTQPVQGAKVQLYAAGTTGNASAPIQLLAQGLITDATGAFSVSLPYTCANGGSMLAVVATGGHVGTGRTNDAITLFSSPGTCDSIASGSSVVVNEATTVSGAFAFAPFLSAGAQLGASSTNAGGLVLAQGTFAKLVDVSTGAIGQTNGTAPAMRIASLANILHACVVADGNTGQTCANLFAATANGGKIPANTFDAALSVAKSPANNIAAIYLASGGANGTPYSPALAAAPSDWTLFVNYAGGGLNAPTSVSVDSGGRVWVANLAGVASLFTNSGVPLFANGLVGNTVQGSFGGAVDSADSFWMVNRETPRTINSGLGNVVVFNSAGQTVSGKNGFTGGGLNFPTSISFDTAGTAWITDYGNSHVTLLDGSGTPQSGTAGYTDPNLQFPVALAVDSKRNGYAANQSSANLVKLAANGTTSTIYGCCDGGSAVAIDAADNAWVTNYYGDSVALVTASGSIAVMGGVTGGGIKGPQAVAIDGDGKAWVANFRGNSLSEFPAASSTQPAMLLSPANGWGSDASLSQSFGLAIDAAGNLWVTNFGNNTLTEFIGMATPVKTPLIGPVRTP